MYKKVFRSKFILYFNQEVDGIKKMNAAFLFVCIGHLRDIQNVYGCSHLIGFVGAGVPVFLVFLCFITNSGPEMSVYLELHNNSIKIPLCLPPSLLPREYTGEYAGKARCFLIVLYIFFVATALCAHHAGGGNSIQPQSHHVNVSVRQKRRRKNETEN